MAADLGESISSPYSTGDGGQAQIFQRGARISNSAGYEVDVIFRLPMIGLPHLATPAPGIVSAPSSSPTPAPHPPAPHPPSGLAGLHDAATDNAVPLQTAAIAFGSPLVDAGTWDINSLIVSIKRALEGRLVLVPTGQWATWTKRTPIHFRLPEKVHVPLFNVDYYGVPTTANLDERQLYDIVAEDSELGFSHVVAPHAVYFRSTWHDFGIAHVTDTHVARRIDNFKQRMEERGRADTASRLINWNDRFRGFIRYANYLHSINQLDVIVVTGDVIDYIFEDDDDVNAGGNALFMRKLILGQEPGPTFADVEELLVPIFLITGNHDYRKNPYVLLFNIDLGLVNAKQVHSFAPYGINYWDALAITTTGSDVPNLSSSSATAMVEIDQANSAFSNNLVDAHSYVLELGSHRIVMIDSAWDVGVVDDAWKAFNVLIDNETEDQASFVGGCPNCRGVTDSDLQLVTDTLKNADPDALVIIGLHAPLFNPVQNEYAFFLRETQRPAMEAYVENFLRMIGSISPSVDPRNQHPGWFPSPNDHRAPTFIVRGTNDDLCDFGVSRGRANELLQAAAGIGTARKADVILEGHTHRYAEFRITTESDQPDQPVFCMDFYTENPKNYYPTRFPITGVSALGRVVWESGTTSVDVEDAAPANSPPTPAPTGAKYKYRVAVPPYQSPLNGSSDAKTWWASHRPLLLETAALGPTEGIDPAGQDEVSFAGFRVLAVKSDVIESIHYIGIQRLQDNDYQLSWEDVITG
jgi:hypothetical protein